MSPASGIEETDPGSGEAGGIDRAVELLRRATSFRPRVFIVLGSGLGGLVEDLSEAVSVPFHELPGLPAVGVEGHQGRLVAGRLAGTPVWIQSGRLHVYEGHPASVVAAPVRIAAALGVRAVILTNAAGGIRADLDAGSLVLLADLLNLTFRNPRMRERGRYASSSSPASPGREGHPLGGPGPFVAGAVPAAIFGDRLQELALEAARRRKVPLSRGVYAGVPGPSFETRAEIRMIAGLGGDVVGMSTIPEALEARARGMEVLGFSLVTNRAAGLRPGALSHDEVVRSAEARASGLAGLIREIVGDLEGEVGS
ncbi:MAG: purine-nucleoside phosphorylase [Gemmatimonadota bacterium]